MSLRKALLAATVLAMPAAASAQPVSGLYIGGGAGLNWLQSTDFDLTGPAATNAGTRRGTVDFQTGYVGVLSLGWGFGNGVRAEIEGSFRYNDLDTLSGFRAATGGRARSDGAALTWGVMGNALYDFYIPDVPVMPYVGVGAGYMIHEYKSFTLGGDAGRQRIDGEDGRFAYQAIVGAAYQLGDLLPGLAVTAEYRFLGTLSQEIDSTYDRRPAGPVGSRGKVEVDNFNHSILIGLRYAFGTEAAPAPVVPPAPEPRPAAAPTITRTFLVFFDWDKADLTERARSIIAEAAQNTQRAGTTRIEVSGHADRSGTPQYNQRLSQRRAEAVAAELERRGVARSAMVIQAFGESRPLVPTADGVREPQNRRVEIVLR